MRFAYPHLLWLLLVVPPALLGFLLWAARRRRRQLTAFITARLLPDLTAGVSSGQQLASTLVITAASALCVVALARPQWGFTWEESRQKGLDIVVAIDTSKSMLAEDIAPNRLTRARLAALELMQLARSDRFGLVAFAGVAFLQCPLTFDDAAFRQSVELLDVNLLPQGGTALAEAITTARTAFKEGDAHKVLVLFSDGEDQDSGAVAAARAAEQDGLLIFTIGIGSEEGELLRVRDAKGRTEYLKDDAGNAVKSRLNEPLLREIATPGRGFYLPLRGAKVMETLYEKGFAALPKSESEARLYKRYHEQFHWPLALAIALLAVESVTGERRRKRAPSAPAVTPAAALCMLALLIGASASASPRAAMKDYEAGRFAAAQREFERLLVADPKADPRLAFNAGTAAYRGTNYEAALKHFNSVLSAPDVKLQQAAFFNLGNLHFRQGEAAPDIDAMEQQWETAIKFFQNAVTLDQTDADAAHNLAFARQCVAQITQLREAAKQAKLAADAATRQRNYRRAREIMEALLRQNPTAQPFAEFAKKLKDIDEIANPPQP